MSGAATAGRDGGLPALLYVVGEQRSGGSVATLGVVLRIRALRRQREAAEWTGTEDTLGRVRQ